MTFGLIVFDFQLGNIVTVPKLLELIGGRIEKSVKSEFRVKREDEEFERQPFSWVEMKGFFPVGKTTLFDE